tara:strand:- start:1019 stop:1981 length:963 start_codon:yes stop_codon:yes gene_type:complete
MSNQLTIKGPLSKDFQQIYVDDNATGIFINNEGKIKGSNLSSNTVDGEVTIGDNNQLHLNNNTIISRSSSDLEIIATAGIDLEPENGVIQFIDKDGSNHIVIGNIQIDGAGLTIAPINLGNLTLDVGGTLTQDSGLGRFVASKAGTEFSATNSAYAGMILGYTHLSPTTAQYVNLTTSLAVVDADAKVTFVAPPSGNVEIGVNYFRDSFHSNKSITSALSDNATFNQATAELGDGSTTWDLAYVYGGDLADETDDRYNTIKFVAGGLTAGSSYTYWLALATSGTTTRIRYGGRQDTDPDRFYPPIIMKATALPASIHTDS